MGYDAGELHDTLVLRTEDGGDLVVHAVAPDGAAVGKHDGVPVVFEQTAEIFLHAALAEIYLGFVFKDEVIQEKPSLATRSRTWYNAPVASGYLTRL